MVKRDENKDLRNFGIFLAVLCGVLGGISYYKGGHAWHGLWLFGAHMLLFAIFFKRVLRPIYKGAMWLGMKMNWVMTRVILTIFFFLFLAPIGLLMRLLGKDLIGRKYDPNAKSFWQPPKRGDYKPEYSERLF